MEQNKRNKTRQNQTERNETNQNETKQNKTELSKQNWANINTTKQNGTNTKTWHNDKFQKHRMERNRTTTNTKQNKWNKYNTNITERKNEQDNTSAFWCFYKAGYKGNAKGFIILEHKMQRICPGFEDLTKQKYKEMLGLWWCYKAKYTKDMLR